MGALTLGIVVPSKSALPGVRGRANSPLRAIDAKRTAMPWMAEQTRSGADLLYGARALGWDARLLRVPNDADPKLLRTLIRSHFEPGAVDRLVVAAHGPAGGSGRIHAAARACGLPVAGPSPEAIASAYDKLLARQRLAFHNLPVPRTVALPQPDRAVVDRGLDRLGWPCVLKPRHGAAGAGVRTLADRAELAEALSGRQRAGLIPKFLLERRVHGREVSVALIDGEVLGAVEVDRAFEVSGSAVRAMVCPPSLDPCELAGVTNLARRACAALGLAVGPIRVDLMICERGNEFILEVEPLPPVHRDSVVARVARARGLSYPQLCARLVACAPRSQARANQPTTITGTGTGTETGTRSGLAG